MIEGLLVVSIVLGLAAVVLAALALSLLRRVAAEGAARAEAAALMLTGQGQTSTQLATQMSQQATQLTMQAAQMVTVATEMARVRDELARLEQSVKAEGVTLRTDLAGQRQEITATLTGELKSQRTATEQTLGALRTALDAQLASTRSETAGAVSKLAETTASTLVSLTDRVTGQLGSQAKAAGEQVELLRGTVEAKLTSIQATADSRLEAMRLTVDEKLSATLNQRLGESFKLVSERLDAVQRGFGEMATLSQGVTDLRKVMSNVKTRGIWGEVQLANLLEQIFTPAQYIANYKPRARGGEVVEFALKLPGSVEGGDGVYLPIDSKFPMEDYQRLIAAADAADAASVDDARSKLKAEILRCAKDIGEKYIHVPATTDFAVLFLPTEGLYSEVMRMPALSEEVLRRYKVVILGPATFSAASMAILMGFRTLAIQKRSADIASLLGAIKTDFGKFADLLGKVENKLGEAQNTIVDARKRSVQIVKKLGKVEALPESQVMGLLPDVATDPDAQLELEGG